MKKRTTTLRLNRETVAKLDGSELKLGGAAGTTTGVGATCPIVSCYEECFPSTTPTCL